ncbi:asparagine synthase-related protein [Metabacillus fastidiosus]|uniref:asparagine synthase-related protein n=1 Tax=Metabacillus fastidiosus TaxID=1458 RepID=UPI002E21401C|nr:asparagine synthase-related protein [Metabacillus fastidiosus]MED4534206.1 asparagine synthase-related protein [Metabacillus fastidiosus]
MGLICGIYKRNYEHVGSESFNKILNNSQYYTSKSKYIMNQANVAMAEFNLNVIPEVRPLNKLTNIGPYYIVADCRLDNRENLIKQLQVEDMYISDSMLIILAYKKWGERCCNYLLGDFVFLIWDKTNNTLFAARDPLGIKPFFYKITSNEFIFSSSIKSIQNTKKVTNWNKDYLIDFLYRKGMPNDYETPYPDIKRLPRGSSIKVSSNHFQIERYWRLDPHKKITYANDEDYIEHFMKIFKDSIVNRLRGSSDVAVMMSGGLDSTSIYAIAKSLNYENSIFPISCVFDEHTEADERHYIIPVLEKYKEKNYEFLVSDDYWILKGFPNYAPDMDEPSRNSLTHSMVLNSYLKAKKRDSNIVLTGYAGDQVFGFNPYYIAEYLRKFRFIKFLSESKQLARSNNDPLIWAIKEYGLKTFKRRHEKPTVLLPRYHEAALERAIERNTIKDPSLRAQYDYIDQAQNLSYTRVVSESLGIETRYPFLDVRLVEFLFAIPTSQKIEEAQTKVLLRKAMKDFLPSAVLNQYGKATTNMLLFEGLKKEWHKIYPILKNSILAEMQIIDGKKFIDQIDRYRHGELTAGMDYISAFQLELWLQEHSK